LKYKAKKSKTYRKLTMPDFEQLFKLIVISRIYKAHHSGRDVINVIPSLALDSSIHAGMMMIWLEQYIF
jgi:hypothetical protein